MKKELPQFEVGEEIMVWDKTGTSKNKRKFLGIFQEYFICEDIYGGTPLFWKYAEKIKKEPEIKTPKFKIGDYFCHNNGIEFYKCSEILKKSDGSYTYNGYEESGIRKPTSNERGIYFR